MENRSRFHENGQIMHQIESCNTGVAPYDLRCYSASYAQTPKDPNKDFKKGNKSIFKCGTSKSWSFNDPEFQRKKRIANYKMYCAEGKAKGSLRKGFKWLKDKYSHVVYGC